MYSLSDGTHLSNLLTEAVRVEPKRLCNIYEVFIMYCSYIILISYDIIMMNKEFKERVRTIMRFMAAGAIKIQSCDFKSNLTIR